jgi:hypothetical protein
LFIILSAIEHTILIVTHYNLKNRLPLSIYANLTLNP